MTSVVACFYKHPVKSKHVFQYSFRGAYSCLTLYSWPPAKKNITKNRRSEKKSRVEKRWGNKKLSLKAISQKLHLPRSRIHRSRCRSRSRCHPWPAVTQRLPRSLRRWWKGMKSYCTYWVIKCFVTCFISFQDFSSTFIDFIYLIHIYLTGLIWFYLSKSGKKNCRRGFLLNAKHKQPFFSTSKRAKSCMIFSCTAGHHKLLHSRHILNL